MIHCSTSGHLTCVYYLGECVGINSFTIKPKHAKLGATFTATAVFTVYNQTGTGEVLTLMTDPYGNQVENVCSHVIADRHYLLRASS
jgi:hypothetical protein